MTDPHDDPDSLDDLASAHLDGDTSPAEAARVASDPGLAGRVERLTAVRDALRTSAETPVDPERRHQAIAAALDAFDQAGASEGPPVATVRTMAPRPTAVGGGGRRTLRLVGIAAAVALLALAVPLIGSLDSGSRREVATGSSDASKEMSLRAGSAGGANDAASSTTAQALAGMTATDLGAFRTLPELADAVRSRVGSDARAAQSSASGAEAPTLDQQPPCATERADGAPTTYTALAELEGRPVVVVVRDQPDGTRTLDVLDRRDCTTITTATL